MSREMTDEELLQLDFGQVPLPLRRRYIKTLGRRPRPWLGGAKQLTAVTSREIADRIRGDHPGWFERLTSAERVWWQEKGFGYEVPNPALAPLRLEFNDISKAYIPPDASSRSVYIELRRMAIATIEAHPTHAPP